MLKVRKFWVAIGLLVILLSLALPAKAFTETSIKYYALKTFPEQECKEQMLQAIEDAFNPSKWIENTDLQPQNRECLGTSMECTARYYAEKYKQIAIRETEACVKAHAKGTVIFFYTNVYNPANWHKTQEGCKDLFSVRIEEMIMQRQQKYNVVEECQTDQNATVILAFGNEDENRLIHGLREYWEQAEQIPIEEKEKAKATLETMFEIVEGMSDQPTEEEISIGAELLLGMGQHKCSLSAADEYELYQGWKLLTDIERRCLPTFLSGIQTYYWDFALDCPHLQADPNNFMQFGFAAGYAQLALDRYFQLGFAERECQEAPTEFQSPATQSKFHTCYYKPKNLLGCVKEFQNKQKEGQQVAEDTEAETLLWGIVIAILIYKGWVFFSSKSP